MSINVGYDFCAAFKLGLSKVECRELADEEVDLRGARFGLESVNLGLCHDHGEAWDRTLQAIAMRRMGLE